LKTAQAVLVWFYFNLEIKKYFKFFAYLYYREPQSFLKRSEEKLMKAKKEKEIAQGNLDEAKS
jgi:hypothetical protein